MSSVRGIEKGIEEGDTGQDEDAEGCERENNSNSMLFSSTVRG